MGLGKELKKIVTALHSLTPIPTRYELALFVFLNLIKHLPSIVQAPTVELKPLSNDLKYAYLGDKDTLPVIICTKFSPSQEDKVI